ncbi:MAG: ATP-binding protein [Raoultibacter sp.]
MKRKIEEKLYAWADRNKGSDRCTPLLLRGARRVGKTYSAQHFGQACFGKENVIYLDFQTDLVRIEEIFSGPTSVPGIIESLSQYLRRSIDPEKNLIIFDEVQLCEKALNALRFFAQSPYRVIATGSELGTALRRQTLPFPSDVEQVFLHPMDFEEFLWAQGEKKMADDIRHCFEEDTSYILHNEALVLCRTYMVVGGMPRVVECFSRTRDYEEVRRIQSEIDATYTADMALYAPRSQAMRIKAVWESIPKQLVRESSKKFKYSDVAKKGRVTQYEEPLEWLAAAGLIAVNEQTNQVTAPLFARGGGSFFKVYMSDTGLMFRKYGIDEQVFLDAITYKSLASGFRGALAENYVMQALEANAVQTYYWTDGTSASEIEFLITDRKARVIALEVKSGDNVSSASLRKFMSKTHAPYALRLSTKNFGFENDIKSIPLYAAFCITGS